MLGVCNIVVERI